MIQDIPRQIWNDCISSALEEVNVNEMGKQSKTPVLQNPKFSSLDGVEKFREKYFQVLREVKDIKEVRKKIEQYLDDVLLPFFEQKSMVDDRVSVQVPTIFGCTVGGDEVKINLSKVKQLITKIKQNMARQNSQRVKINSGDLQAIIDKFE